MGSKIRKHVHLEESMVSAIKSEGLELSGYVRHALRIYRSQVSAARRAFEHIDERSLEAVLASISGYAWRHFEGSPSVRMSAFKHMNESVSDPATFMPGGTWNGLDPERTRFAIEAVCASGDSFHSACVLALDPQEKEEEEA